MCPAFESGAVEGKDSLLNGGSGKAPCHANTATSLPTAGIQHNTDLSPADQGVFARCHQEHSSRLRLLRKHWDFFSTQNNFNTKMTNSLRRSKFPDVLQLLLSQSQGCFVGNAVLWERGPQGRSRAASKEGSSSQEAQQQTFLSQNAWVWLHSMKS